MSNFNIRYDSAVLIRVSYPRLVPRSNMPELPEVETIKNQLARLIVGKKISAVEIKLPKMVKMPAAQFQKAIIGAKIKAAARRAKILVFELSNSQNILTHLKMSGQLIFRAKDQKITPDILRWNHLIYRFSDGSRLLHNDLRQFGYVKLITKKGLAEFFKKEAIGPEPLEKDFTFNIFCAILARRPKAKIKQFLMDPKNIAGIGNIYSDEILFYAGINPLRKVAALAPPEQKKIFQGIKKILPCAIAARGTSADQYIDANGKKGDYIKYLKVYGREDEKCPRCGAIIQRVKIGGRSAHFCPACQK